MISAPVERSYKSSAVRVELAGLVGELPSAVMIVRPSASTRPSARNTPAFGKIGRTKFTFVSTVP